MFKKSPQQVANASIRNAGGRRMIRSSPITKTRPAFDMTKEVKKEAEKGGKKG